MRDMWRNEETETGRGRAGDKSTGLGKNLDMGLGKDTAIDMAMDKVKGVFFWSTGKTTLSTGNENGGGLVRDMGGERETETARGRAGDKGTGLGKGLDTGLGKDLDTGLGKDTAMDMAMDKMQSAFCWSTGKATLSTGWDRTLVLCLRFCISYSCADICSLFRCSFRSSQL